jgi:hypothetical protein
MQILKEITGEIKNKKCFGGSMLNVIYDNYQRRAGFVAKILTCELFRDTQAQQICLLLLHKGCVPYFKMLEEWLLSGQIVDPYHEFMICQNPEEDLYPPHRIPSKPIILNLKSLSQYTVEEKNVFALLRSSADRILDSGTYFHVIQSMEKNSSFHSHWNLEFSFTTRQEVGFTTVHN